jgi:hypothetical protein
VPITAGQLITPNLLASTDQGATFSILPPGEEFTDVDARPARREHDGPRRPGGRRDAPARPAGRPDRDPRGAPAEEPTTAEPEEGEEPAPEDGPKRVAGPSTKTTLQHLDILVRNGTLYILRTDLATAEKITQLQAAGAQFTFVLRADQDDRVAETEGSTLDRLLEEFGFPVPEEAELP